MKSRWYVLGPAIVMLLLVLNTITGQEKATAKKKDTAEKIAADARRRQVEILQALAEPLETRHFAQDMPLKTAIAEIAEQFERKGKNVPIIIDTVAFKNDDMKDPYDATVKAHQVQRALAFDVLLRQLLAQVPVENDSATFLLRNDQIVITTRSRSAPAFLLREPVLAVFNDKPLDEALEDLSWQTGATILLDSRLGDMRKTRITAAFKQTVSLDTAVRLLAEMADLKAELRDDVLFVTEKKAQPAAGAALEFQGVRIDEALKRVAEATGASIVIEPETLKAIRDADLPRNPAIIDPTETRPTYRVTAAFRGELRAQPIVHTLTEMTKLYDSQFGNVIYITGYPSATQYRASAGGPRRAD